MASLAKMTIRVRSARGSSTIQFSTAGRYINLPTNGIGTTLPREPIQPTTSTQAFWESVLAVVTAQVNALLRRDAGRPAAAARVSRETPLGRETGPPAR